MNIPLIAAVPYQKVEDGGFETDPYLDVMTSVKPKSFSILTKWLEVYVIGRLKSPIRITPCSSTIFVDHDRIGREDLL